MTSSEHDPSDLPGPVTTAASRKPGRWWLPVATFVVGVVVGIVGLGLLSTGTAASTASGDGPGPAPGVPKDVPLTATASVNEACLRVINDAQAVYGVLSGVGQLDPDVDLRQVDALVRRLEPLQPRLEQDLPACRVGSAGAGSTPSSVPSTPEPTAAPTR